jgi:RimJ/RimL family protein N-acetyltransferase
MGNALNMYDIDHNGQSRSAPVDPRPLSKLTLRTPRLELRCNDDAGVFELAAEAKLCTHPPAAGEVIRRFWRARADHRTDDWHVNFLIRFEGQLIGALTLEARDFPTTRQIKTGSWIGQRHQGNGYAREARAALLLFAFDHLGARCAMSVPLTDYACSLDMIVTKDRFDTHRPPWNIEATGLDMARPALGL